MHNNIDTDAAIILTPVTHPNFLTGESLFAEPIQIIGNRSLASDIIDLCKQLNIDRIVEHDLSKVFGDIPAHRITSAGKNFMQWHTESFNALSQALNEFLTEEKPVLAKPDATRQLFLDIQELQYRIEAVERRVNGLMASMSSISDMPYENPAS